MGQSWGEWLSTRQLQDHTEHGPTEIFATCVPLCTMRRDPPPQQSPCVQKVSPTLSPMAVTTCAPVFYAPLPNRIPEDMKTGKTCLHIKAETRCGLTGLEEATMASKRDNATPVLRASFSKESAFGNAPSGADGAQLQSSGGTVRLWRRSLIVGKADIPILLLQLSARACWHHLPLEARVRTTTPGLERSCSAPLPIPPCLWYDRNRSATANSFDLHKPKDLRNLGRHSGEVDGDALIVSGSFAIPVVSAEQETVPHS